MGEIFRMIVPKCYSIGARTRNASTSRVRLPIRSVSGDYITMPVTPEPRGQVKYGLTRVRV